MSTLRVLFLLLAAATACASPTDGSATEPTQDSSTNPAPTATGAPASTAAPTTAPTPTPAPSHTPVPASTPLPTSTPMPTAVPEPSVWMPGDGWKPVFIHHHVQAPADPTQRADSITFTVDGDLLGPTAWAYALPDVDNFRRVGSPGGTYYDVTDSHGRMVRVRDDDRPEAVLAVVDTPPGTMVVIGYGLDDAQVLAVVDALTSDGSRIDVAIDQLPAHLTPTESHSPAQEPSFDPPLIASVMFARATDDASSPGQRVDVTVISESSQSLLNARSWSSNPVEIQVGTGTGIAFISNGNPLADTGAVFVVDELAHEVRIDAAGAAVTVDDVIALLDGFEPTTLTQIGTTLGHPDRRDLLRQWIAATPLPPQADVEWLLDGPPVAEFDLAWVAHHQFGCAWLREWARTGDAGALDQLDAATDWPTAQIVSDELSEAHLPGPGTRLQEQFATESLAELDADARADLVAVGCGA